MYGLAMLHLVASIAKHHVTKVKCEFIRFCKVSWSDLSNNFSNT